MNYQKTLEETYSHWLNEVDKSKYKISFLIRGKTHQLVPRSR
jgi:hypothetical protein